MAAYEDMIPKVNEKVNASLLMKNGTRYKEILQKHGLSKGKPEARRIQCTEIVPNMFSRLARFLNARVTLGAPEVQFSGPRRPMKISHPHLDSFRDPQNIKNVSRLVFKGAQKWIPKRVHLLGTQNMSFLGCYNT